MNYNKRFIAKFASILSGLVFIGSVTASNMDAADHPKNFVTRNYTQYLSNARVGLIWSPYPTPAATPGSYSERAVNWTGLKALCGFLAETCGAKIYMYTAEDPSNKIYVGEGVMDMSTGEVTPKTLTNNGFTLTSPAPAVIEIRKAD